MISFKRISFVLALVIVAVTSEAFAEWYVKLGEIKGESKDRIVRCPDGSCVIEDIPSGNFTVTVCDAKGNPVTTDNLKVTVQFNPKELSVTKSSTARESPTKASTGVTTAVSSEVVSPRDAASGRPTGKRQHKPITITKEWGASTPKLMMKTPSGDEHSTVIKWSLEVRVDRIEMK